MWSPWIGRHVQRAIDCARVVSNMHTVAIILWVEPRCGVGPDELGDTSRSKPRATMSRGADEVMDDIFPDPSLTLRHGRVERQRGRTIENSPTISEIRTLWQLRVSTRYSG